MTAVLGLAAALSVVTGVPASAEGHDYLPSGGVERKQDVQASTTDGNSYMEINSAGQLVLWRRTGETFYGEVRGSDWNNTRIISTLSANSFLEVKGDGRLAKWTWNGGTYIQQIVGSGWNNARLVTGVSANKFLEINQQGNLVLWTFDAANNLFATVRGTGWENTKSITGLGDLDFMEVKGADPQGVSALSEWIDFNGLQETKFEGSDFSRARLMAGTDVNHFVVIDGVDGTLLEFTYTESDNTWHVALRGSGWGGTRLIG
ncbi:hypothetical protein FKR81_22245 [Lentzea tibetensis]|uniref:Bulb-type lectin domain-containing protein n=1 Tax=Lentzea tibetensis TaxID=2591470 RepID=A0A563ES61_9PSEU|nr:hypothetical protein [Lentzea tibetensis]TWP49958.1 hypothetical protein FKR81_22245 [Lentzea tibetensis]